jgi:hypothetical protein
MGRVRRTRRERETNGERETNDREATRVGRRGLGVGFSEKTVQVAVLGEGRLR